MTVEETRTEIETRGLVVKEGDPVPAGGSAWTFLTNHSHVLLCLAQDPSMRLRDVADRVGITERAVQRIVADLETGGVLVRSRDGRRNNYVINGQIHLRHPVEKHSTLYDLIRGILRTLPAHVLLRNEDIAAATGNSQYLSAGAARTASNGTQAGHDS